MLWWKKIKFSFTIVLFSKKKRIGQILRIDDKQVWEYLAWIRLTIIWDQPTIAIIWSQESIQCGKFAGVQKNFSFCEFCSNLANPSAEGFPLKIENSLEEGLRLETRALVSPKISKIGFNIVWINISHKCCSFLWGKFV